MECDSNLRRGSVVCRTSKIVRTTAEAVAMQNMKLQEQFQMDAKLSYAHFHHSIKQNVENIPSSSSDYERSPRIEADSNDDDELVKYMSNLPAFLRKPETVQEKTFSVGVLDWGRLEKWQNRHKQMLPRNTTYSMSCSSASSSFSTELSSSNSSRGRSCSPTQQGMQRLTLQSHLLASPRGTDPHLFDRLCENIENHMHNIALRRNKLNGKLLQAVETVESQNNGAVPCIGSRTEGLPGKDVEKVPGSDCGSILESFPAPRRLVTDPEMSEKPNNVVILMPSGASKQDASESAVTQPSDLQVNAGKKTIEMSRRGTAENVRGAHCSKFLSEIPRPISLEVDLRKQAQGKRHGTMDMANLKHEGFHRPPPLTRVPVSLSVVGTTEIRKPSAVPPPLDARLLRGSDSKTNASSEKARSSSPLHRLGHSMAKIVKNSSSKEGATGNQHDSARSGFEKAEPLASRDISIHNKSNSAGRSRSSPLRRLLDPILKPKTSDSYNCENPLLKSSISNDVLCGRAAGQPVTMNLQSANMKRDIAGCRMIHINDNSHLDKRDGSVTVQALLRLASKNGLPLLTFAVDNDSDILAATMKNSSSSEKDHHGWSYTFFKIREVRKKNGGWIYQGGKSKVSKYVPNFVAHMKVSDIEPPTSRLLEEDSSCLREFVLLGVDKGQQEWNTPDFQPHDELAAIVTKTPMHERLFQNQCSGACDPYPGGNSKDRMAVTTVILPSGSHSLPSSGGPSSLIERWRSGGSCDCGGWDVGCKLKILSSDDHLCRKLSSGEASSSEEDSFSLFSQADVPDEKPAFSLTPFKDKIYSVEFKSRLSVLQTFSICIAVLDSRKLIGSLDDNCLCKVKEECKPGHQKLPDSYKYIILEKLPHQIGSSSYVLGCLPLFRDCLLQLSHKHITRWLHMRIMVVANACGGKNELCYGRGPRLAFYLDFSQCRGDNSKEGEKVCPAAMGFAFAAGTTDGPGAFDFKQEDDQGNPFWKLVRNLLKTPNQEQINCQHPKLILHDTGEMKQSNDWAPSVLPVQILRIRKLVILCVPGERAEFTTMAGRRLRDAVKTVLASGGNNQFNGDVDVVIAGLSNTYSQYITTFEEYQVQHYEGASTLYGPHTHSAYIQELTKLASTLLKGQPTEPGPQPPDLLSRQ